MMSRRESQAAEFAAGQVLTSIASREGMLLKVLSGLRLISTSDNSGSSAGFHTPPLSEQEAQEMAETLKNIVPAEIFGMAERSTGFSREQILRPAVEQLRHVAIFATSDGESTLDNIRAVEKLVRSGRVDMFAGA